MIHLTNIGKLGRTYKKEGSLRLYIEEVYSNELQNAKALFVYINGCKVPFMIKNLEGEDGHFVVKLKTLDTPEDARLLTDKKVYLSGIQSEAQIDGVLYKEFVGFHVQLNSGKEIGVIDHFEEHPKQILTSITTKEGTVLLPFHDQLILKLDPENKTIQFDYDEEVVATLLT